MKTTENILTILGDMRNLMLGHKSVLTLEQFETYSGLSKSTIYKLTLERKIPHYKPGGKKIYFRRSEVDEWLLNNPISPVNSPYFRINENKSKRYEK
jgi:excisionase family DNA binding protein